MRYFVLIVEDVESPLESNQEQQRGEESERVAEETIENVWKEEPERSEEEQKRRKKVQCEGENEVPMEEGGDSA